MGSTDRPATARVLFAGAAAGLAVVTGVVLARPSGGDAPQRAAAVVAVSPGVHAVVAAATAAAPTASVAAPSSSSTPRPPAPDPCRDSTEPKEVFVSIAEQHMWLCARHTVAADFPVTTGRASNGDATPTGTFQVQARTTNTTLAPDSGGSFHVKFWIPFKWGMYGFHDAPWQGIPFGSPRYRTNGSHGCVHMRTADIARLFGWVALGTTIRVVAGDIA